MQQLQTRLITYFTPVLLITIALLQMYTAHTQGLTPWKGGGFGMFSTVDSGGARFFRIYLTGADGEVVPVDLPNRPSYDRLKSKLRRLPQPALLAQLANQLAAETWVPSNYNAFRQGQEPAAAHNQPGYRVAYDGEPAPADVRVAVQQLRIELWRYRFDGQSGLVEAAPWQEYTYSSIGL